MGRKSTKENKNIYQLCREKMGYTREAAAERMQHVSADRIEKIESEKTLPHPDEVLAMAKCYKSPALCNNFCSHTCPIGRETISEVESKELTQITLELVSLLNTLDSEKNRLIEISADGEITDSEKEDFLSIKSELEKLSRSVDSLKLWIDNTVASGKADKDFFI